MRCNSSSLRHNLFAYYAAGMSLAESFYLAVESPYQLLIVGDPLCRPYGFEHASKFEIAAATCDEPRLAPATDLYRWNRSGK